MFLTAAVSALALVSGSDGTFLLLPMSVSLLANINSAYCVGCLAPRPRMTNP